MEKVRFNKLRLIIISALLALLACCAFFGINRTSANAETDSTISYEYFMTETNLEYFELSSPKDVVYRENICAFIQGNKTLVVYRNGAFTKKDFTEFTTLRQIKFLNDRYLLLNADTNIYMIDVSDLSKSKLEYNEIQLSGNYFDINENYIITGFNDTISVYQLVDGVISGKGIIPNATGDKPITINGLNEIFFVNTSSNLCKFNAIDAITGADVTPTVIVENFSSDNVIANDTNIFYIFSNKLYTVQTTENGTGLELTYQRYDDYDLGNILTPHNLAFKGENILVVDSANNSISEFIFNGVDNSLNYSGFSIAKGKTAYNRISANALEIDNYDGFIAVLDKNKILLVDEGKTSYNNIFIDDVTEFTDYYTIALGKTEIALANKITHDIRFIEFDGTVNSTTLTLGGDLTGYVAITDICYQSGYYYASVLNGTTSSTWKLDVYKISIDEDKNVSSSIILDTSAGIFDDESNKIAVDVFGDIYLSATNNDVYKCAKIQDGTYDFDLAEKVVTDSSIVITKMITDLNGELFTFDKNNIYHHLDSSITSYPITLSYNYKNAKTFTFDYLSNKVYFLTDNEELIFTTSSLPNLTVSDLRITSDYVITKSSADIDTLNICKIKHDANIYSVTPDMDTQSFAFNKLLKIDYDNTEFILICKVNTNFAVLIGNDLENNSVTIIVNDREIIENVKQPTASENSKAYITTGVSSYYFPLITFNGEYALTYSTGTPIRLFKGTEINTTRILNFCDKDYYYASVNIDGNIYYGYVPVDFTVLTLSEDDLGETFVIRNVSQTEIFSDKDLTVKISSIAEDTECKIYETDGDVSYISFIDDDNVVYGYISKDSIITPSDNTLRNALIILAAAVSVCGTSLYFVLRKKKS